MTMTKSQKKAFLAAEAKIFETVLDRVAAVAAQHGRPRIEIVLEWNGRFSSRAGDALVCDKVAYEKTGKLAWMRLDPKSVIETLHPRLFVGRVRLSSKLWEMFTPEGRLDTMIHEVCHIYANLEDWNAKHGPVWKRWMVRCGANPAARYGMEKVADKNAFLASKGYVQAPCPGCGAAITLTKKMVKRWRPLEIRVHPPCGTHLDQDWAKTAKAPTTP